MKKIIYTLGISLSLFFVCIFCACAQNNSYGIADQYAGFKHNDNYQLEQMTILSRHNVRSPITNKDSEVNKNCSHEWHQWSSNPGELTLHGGQCETKMGQYFRQYLEQEKLIPVNWIPVGDEAKFYSNSFQRTIATSNYFLSGLLPVSNIDVIYKKELGQTDQVFLPKFYNIDNQFKVKVEKEVNDLFDGNYKNLNAQLYDNMKLIQDVIGYKGQGDISNKEVSLSIENGKSPSSKGFVDENVKYADALIMQYYEEPDNSKAAFGKNLNFSDWKKIGDILSADLMLNCGSHTECLNSMKPMLDEVKADINDTDRKFTFLCGHDTTLTPFLSALNIKWESLPYTPTDISPIGGKVVFSKFKNNNGEEYVSLNYVYGSDGQIRNDKQINLDNPPVVYPIELKGLQKNSDGFYNLSDINKRLSGLD